MGSTPSTAGTMLHHSIRIKIALTQSVFKLKRLELVICIISPSLNTAFILKPKPMHYGEFYEYDNSHFNLMIVRV